MSKNSDQTQELLVEVEAAAPEDGEEQSQKGGVEQEELEESFGAKPEPKPEPYIRTDKYDRFLDEGISHKVSEELDKIYQKKLSEGDELDRKAIAAVKKLDEETALQVLEHFYESDLSCVQNKSSYLRDAIKMFRTKRKNVGSKPEPDKITVADEAKIKSSTKLIANSPVPISKMKSSIYTCLSGLGQNSKRKHTTERNRALRETDDSLERKRASKRNWARLQTGENLERIRESKKNWARRQRGENLERIRESKRNWARRQRESKRATSLTNGHASSSDPVSPGAESQ